MTVHYYPDTVSLYIDLADRPNAGSREVTPGVVLDYGSGGGLVGIDIDHASRIANLSAVRAESLPVVAAYP